MGKPGSGTVNARIEVAIRLRNGRFGHVASTLAAGASLMRRAHRVAPGAATVLSLLTVGEDRWMPLLGSITDLLPPQIDVSDGNSAYSYYKDLEVVGEIGLSADEIREAHAALKKIAFSSDAESAYMAEQVLKALVLENDGRSFGGAGAGFIMQNLLSRASMSGVLGKVALPEKCINDFVYILKALLDNRAPTLDELNSPFCVSGEHKYTSTGYVKVGSNNCVSVSWLERCQEVDIISTIHQQLKGGDKGRVFLFLGRKMAPAIERGQIYACRQSARTVRVIDTASDVPPLPLADEEEGSFVAVRKTELCRKSHEADLCAQRCSDGLADAARRLREAQAEEAEEPKPRGAEYLARYLAAQRAAWAAAAAAKANTFKPAALYRAAFARQVSAVAGTVEARAEDRIRRPPVGSGGFHLHKLSRGKFQAVEEDFAAVKSFKTTVLERAETLGVAGLRTCEVRQLQSTLASLIQEGLDEDIITPTTFKAEALRARSRLRIIHNDSAVDIWTILKAVFAGFNEAKELTRLLAEFGGYSPIATKATTLNAKAWYPFLLDFFVDRGSKVKPTERRATVLYAHAAGLVARFKVEGPDVIEALVEKYPEFRGAAAEALSADPHLYLTVSLCNPIIYTELAQLMLGSFGLPPKVVAKFLGGGDVDAMLAAWPDDNVSLPLRKALCEGLCRGDKLLGKVEPMLQNYVDLLAPPLAMLCLTHAHVEADTVDEAMALLEAFASPADRAFEDQAVARALAAGARRDWFETLGRGAYVSGFGAGTVHALDIDSRFGGDHTLDWGRLSEPDGLRTLPIGARCRRVSGGADVYIVGPDYDSREEGYDYIVADASGLVLVDTFKDDDLEPYVRVRKRGGNETAARLTEIYVHDGLNFQHIDQAAVAPQTPAAGWAPPQEPRPRPTKRSKPALPELDLARVTIFRADGNHQLPVLAEPRPPRLPNSSVVPPRPPPRPVAQLPVPHLPKKRPCEPLDDVSADSEEDLVQYAPDDRVELVGDGLVASLKGATGRVLGEPDPSTGRIAPDSTGKIAVELAPGQVVKFFPGDLKVDAAAAMAS